MNGRLARYTDIAFALMRFVTGVLLACHGVQKLFGVFGGQAMIKSPLIVAAGVIEIACGVLVAIGLLTRPAAFIASGEMAVAYFKAHAPAGFWPIQNKGEAAVIFCFLFLFIAAHGAGRYSIDALVRRGQGAGEKRSGETP